MKKLITVFPAVIILLYISGCDKKPEKEIVLAQVNNSRFTLRNLEEDIPLGFQEIISNEQKEDYINRWIDDELLYQEALQEKLDLEPDINYALIQLKRDYLIEKLVERKLEKKIIITEEEIKVYFDDHQDDFILEEPVIRAQQVLVKDQNEGWKILAQAQKGEDFGALVKKHSLHPSADLEGDMGYFTEWDLDPQVAKRCFRLEPGKLSSLIKSKSGYHIFKVLDKRKKGDPKPLALVRESIINKLDQKKKKESVESLVRELKKKHTITVNLTALENDHSPSPVTHPAPARSDQARPAEMENP